MSFVVFFLMIRLPPCSTRTDTLFPYTTLFRSGGGDRALPVPHPLRVGELGAVVDRHRTGRLARRSELGDADDHPVRGVEELRLQHDHLPRRAAVDPRG